MSKRKRPSKKEVIEYVLELTNRLGRNPKRSDFVTLDNVNYYDIIYYFQNLNSLFILIGLPPSGTYRGHEFADDELISIFQDFVSTQGFVPSQFYWDKNSKMYKLPSRKTFTRRFGSWKNVIHLCGYDEEIEKQHYILDNTGKYILKHDNKEFLEKIIIDYIDEYDKIPTLEEIGLFYGVDLKFYYQKYFGTWNNCLEYLGIQKNLTYYTDDELKKYFLEFVNNYKRVPTIQDFNKTGRPSFWCYQQRFGSWAKACIYYGFEPNHRKPHYYMEDGERCDSRYEYDISTWLKENNINYDRDVPYKDFTTNYNGKMNCDYRFVLDNGEVWYVEMAGFIDTNDFKKLTSREEEIYYFKLKYKKKLFKENNLNYIIIHPSDLKTYTMDEIFYFFNNNKRSA